MKVDVLPGNIFEGGSDLTVLPCSPKPSISAFTRTWVDLFRLADPTKAKTRMVLGDLSKVRNFRHNSRKTRKYVFAASVLNNFSDTRTIVRIGQQLGELTKADPTIRQIECPMLGTGAGGLSNEVAARAIAIGFKLTAVEDARLSLFSGNTSTCEEARVGVDKVHHDARNWNDFGVSAVTIQKDDVENGQHLYDAICVCENCQRINALVVDKGRRSSSNLYCPYCFFTMKVERGSGEAAYYRVEGQNADEVLKVVNALPHGKNADEDNTGRNMSDQETKADIVILAALDKELDAVLRTKGYWEAEQNSEDIRTYYKTITPNGVRIAAARASEMGQLGAAMLARDAIERFSPKKIILTGIAASLDDDVTLGDIVISDQIIDYELGKVKNGVSTPRWSAYRSDALLRQRLFDAKSDSSWVELVDTPRPDGEAASKSTIHTGVVMSGNKVIADEQAAGSLKAVWSRALALEMEAAGIAAVIHQHPKSIGFTMVKSICDHADSSKNDDWQQYASEASAAYVLRHAFKSISENDAIRVLSERSQASPQQEAGLDVRTLRLALDAAYDLNELRVLVADINLDWDNIAGETKDLKISELIKLTTRRGSLSRLINIVIEERGEMFAEFDGSY